jgi:hypothetical protein
VYFDEQRLLLFLQSYHYKPKETLEGMNNHLNFRKEYLPIDFSKVEKLLVILNIFRSLDFFTPAVGIKILGLL